MSLKYHVIGRTAKILKDYEAVQRQGKNGTFESKMIMFSIATDREYKQSVTQSDGSIKQERATDFWTCRATGPVADLFNKYCNTKKYDEQGNQKLVSRRIALEGHLEKYKAERKVTLPATINGTQYNITGNVPEEREILVVESIEFLDANPSNNNGGSATTATEVSAVTVVAPAEQSNVQAVEAVQADSTEVAPF